MSFAVHLVSVPPPRGSRSCQTAAQTPPPPRNNRFSPVTVVSQAQRTSRQPGNGRPNHNVPEVPCAHPHGASGVRCRALHARRPSLRKRGPRTHATAKRKRRRPRTVAWRTATQTASIISAGQSHRYRQPPTGPLPAHTGYASEEKKRPTLHKYSTGAAMERKPPAKAKAQRRLVTTARAQSSPASPGQSSESRTRPKISAPAPTTTPGHEDRHIPKNYTNDLKWLATRNTKG